MLSQASIRVARLSQRRKLFARGKVHIQNQWVHSDASQWNIIVRSPLESTSTVATNSSSIAQSERKWENGANFRGTPRTQVRVASFSSPISLSRVYRSVLALPHYSLEKSTSSVLLRHDQFAIKGQSTYPYESVCRRFLHTSNGNDGGMHNNMRFKTPRARGFTVHDKNHTFLSTMNRIIERAAFSTTNTNTGNKNKGSVAQNSASDAFDAFDNAARQTPTSTSSSFQSAAETEPIVTPSSSLTESKKSYTSQAKDIILAATKSIVKFLMALPGNMWFYLTNPAALREKLSDFYAVAKHEAHHYYMGTKLLIADLRTARNMVARTLQGSVLSRRERKQLLRTVTDLFRLVPFSMFIIIPFMEFALPFALRLFPNMLPSTFQDSLKAEENMKRELQSRIAMASFFQETLRDLAKEQKKKAAKRIEQEGGDATENIDSEKAETAASFLDFVENARKGEPMPPDVIIKYSQYFQDELTLDNMSRMQLINMCKYMSIPPYGSDSFLRFQLRHRVRSLKEDDQKILWEGIGSLTKMELREACRERGMRSTGLSKEAYRRALQQWIDLSVNKDVPISLLIMSRTFFLREEMTTRTSPDKDGSMSVAGLADAISGLDKGVVNEIALEVASYEESQRDPGVRKIKLEVIEQQNELIAEERKEREAAEKEKEAAEKEPATAVPAPSAADSSSPVYATAEDIQTDKSSQSSPEGLNKVSEAVELEKVEEEEHELSVEEIDAISQLISTDPVEKEREQLNKIRAAMKDDAGEAEKVKEAETKSHPEEKMEAGRKVVALNIKIEPAPPNETMLGAEAAEKQASVEIKMAEDAVQNEFQKTIKFSLPADEQQKITEHKDDKLDKAITRLQSKVASMVDKIDMQLSDVQDKIGDKLHFLDLDRDGILSQEEMASVLQKVLKRELTFEEAMEIASDMDENEDGFFTVAELRNWVETNKLVKLVEEGRDAAVDEIIATRVASIRQDEQVSSEEPKT